MKKIIALLGLVMLITACQMSDKTNVDKIGGNLSYFKDPRTGLCFATINSSNSYGSVTSITCVPCEALKNVKVEILK